MRQKKTIGWLLALVLFVTAIASNAAPIRASAEEAAPLGTVTMTVEKFTIGQGYYLEPVLVPFYEGDNGADLLLRAVGEGNVHYGGTADSGFYVQEVKDPVAEAVIPEYILSVMESPTPRAADDEWLGQLDYSYQAGWMNTINNVPPDVGLSDYVPHDGDVIRNQFTLYGWGSDIFTSQWAPGLIDFADKDDLTTEVAMINSNPELNALLSDSSFAEAYSHANDVLKNLESTQAEVDNALAALDGEVEKDRVAPELVVTGLTGSMTATAKSIGFQVAAADNVSSDVELTVTLNGVELTGTDGAYTALLNSGANSIVVSAKDAAGNRTEKSFTVLYDLQSNLRDQLSLNLAKIVADYPNPKFGTSGGEWSVLSLARADYSVPSNYYQTYYENVINSVNSLMTTNGGLLDKNKSTEHARLIIGLAATGYKAEDVAGYDITKALSDYDYVIKQGMNGPIYALIAMDTRALDFPQAEEGKTQATRDNLISYILDKEINSDTSKGGWALFGTKADVDITGMALQALAPYYGKNTDVTAAVDRAVAWLSSTQNATGGYASFGSTSSESVAQVIAGLSELGIDSASDARFVKNGYSALDALMAFAVPTGGFRHVLTGNADGMATDQGTYALVAYERMKAGKTRLYDMSDIWSSDPGQEPGDGTEVELPEGDQVSVDIPDEKGDYRISISKTDAGRDITIKIPEGSTSKISLNLPSGSKLPRIEAVKGSANVVIPQGATVTEGDSSSLEWLTVLNAENEALKNSVDAIVEDGREFLTISQAITLGGASRVAFDSYVTLTFAGMKGKEAAYLENGTAHPIKKFADDSAGIQSGLDEYAYDGGEDLVIKTKHFTDYVAYLTKAASTGGVGVVTPTPTNKATLSVDKTTIGKGYVIQPSSIDLQAGDTAWSVLKRELDAKGLEYSYEWSEEYNSVYVQSIAGDGEFDHGAGSGWKYNVNGVYPNYGASQYTLQNGDIVQWRYTTNLGEDLGENPSQWQNGGSGSSIGKDDLVVTIHQSLSGDFTYEAARLPNESGKIYYNIPMDSTFKFFLNLKNVKDAIPSLIVNRNHYSLTFDYGTKLTAGGDLLEMFASVDPGAAELSKLVQAGLGEGAKLQEISNAFSMGASDGSFVFDKPVTLAIKGAEDQQVGFIENGTFTPITFYKTAEQGASATTGKEKFAYAYADGDSLIVKTNHFTTYVTYSTLTASEEAYDLKKLYPDASLISSWAFDPMTAAAKQGFVQGANGKLNPKTTITRAEFTKLLVSVLGLAASQTKTNGFKDVTADKWFYAYVNTAYQAGFVSGSGDTFNPNDTITREQMASILARALNASSSSDTASIADLNQVSSWAKSDVQKILSLQIMKGQGDKFAPKDSVTREMAVVVAMRAYEYRQEHSAGNGSTAAEVQAAAKNQIASTAAFMQKTITDPTVNSIGGEWTVFGLARSGAEVPNDYYEKYLANLENTLKEKDGNLHSVKYTEYDRVILALTALNKNVSDVAGYNLLEKLADYDTLIKQGINGPIFALIALDSKKYEIPNVSGVKTQTTRELLIDFILNREIAGGGWALGTNAKEADPDIASMSIQALAPYYGTNEKVRAAIDRGVEWLSKAQLADGGYSSSQTVNSESIAQVVVALASLGIDPQSDPRFVKNGHSALEALLGFAAPNGGFYHIKAGGIADGGATPGDVDAMATDQAMYALVAYNRLVNGSNRLYDLTDI